MKHQLFWCLVTVLIAPIASEAAYIDAEGCCRHGSQFNLAFATLAASPCDPGTDPTNFDGVICQVITEQGVAPDGHHEAELEVTRFDMTGAHPFFGDLAIELDASRPGMVSTLRSVNPGSDFPVIHTTRINITATAEDLPGVVLQNHGPPVEFTGEPSNSWPPEVNTYTLPVDVPFEDRDHPGTILFTACAGTVMVYHDSTSVPTLSQLGVLVLTVMVAGGGALFISRR